MENKDINRSGKKVSPELGPKENSTKRRKKVSDGVDEPKWCHQCRHQELVFECKKCKSKKYCIGCITKWYPHVTKEEFVKACPVCCNNCNCKSCLRGFSSKDMQQGYSCSEPNKIEYSKQILNKVFPLVRVMNEDQLMEKEIEAKLKGVYTSELELQDADVFCDSCGSYFFDLYRSCPCGYVLCLVCCRELRDGQLKGGGWKACVDGSIPCPPKDIGGCNDGTLELKHVICDNWVVNVLEKAQRVYKINNGYDNPQTCMECNAGCLCSLSAKDIEHQHMQHFQLHWSKGEPVIVNDVVSTSSGLSWEPTFLWRAFPDIRKGGNRDYEVKAINCLDWSEVTINLGKFCRGYSECQVKRQGSFLILKLEDWRPPSCLYGEWPRHFIEFINCLPFKDYTNPHNGYLNMAVKLPDLSSKPDMGPKMDIAYGVEQELEYGNSVTKLHYEKSDTVNVLTHTKSGVLTFPLLNKTKLFCEASPQRDEGGALWDIFQRQDVPKLEKYLRNHSAEFRLPVKQVFHPIHDRAFYLNMKHKWRLKEEFGIEPWTFKQKLGDAVFIPAGCPYQVKNLKSSTKVELNFISPESVGECIRLQKELRILPKNHKAKQQKLNIGKMLIYALDHAVAELSGPMDSNNPTEFTNCMQTATFNIQPSSVDHKPVVLEDPGTSEGLWRGNAVGQPAKQILQAVENRYPETFQGLQILPKPYWLSSLKELHDFIKRFLETSVHALAKAQLDSLETDLNFFEKIGFNLSWARDRIDMVRNLKFGNDPLRLELVALEESLTVLHLELVEAKARFEKATEARNKKAHEVAQKFGGEYDDVLNGHLGFGMLPGY